MVGREVFFYLEVLMLKYNKTCTCPYLLLLLHPNVQAYHTLYDKHRGNAEKRFNQITTKYNSLDN